MVLVNGVEGIGPCLSEGTTVASLNCSHPFHRLKEQVGVLQYPTSIRETHSSRDGAGADALKSNGKTRHWGPYLQKGSNSTYYFPNGWFNLLDKYILVYSDFLCDRSSISSGVFSPHDRFRCIF